MFLDDQEEKPGLKLTIFGESKQDEICKLLESCKLFDNFEHKELKLLARYAGVYEADSGVRIFTEGERSKAMCILVSGLIHISKENKYIASVRPGKTMGEMSIIDGCPYSATAVTTEKSTLVCLSKADIAKLTEHHTKVAVKLYIQLARLISLRLRQTTGVLLDRL